MWLGGPSDARALQCSRCRSHLTTVHCFNGQGGGKKKHGMDGNCGGGSSTLEVVEFYNYIYIYCLCIFGGVCSIGMIYRSSFLWDDFEQQMKRMYVFIVRFLVV